MTTKNTVKEKKVVPLIGDTCLSVIKNSVGSKLFRNLYAKIDGEKTDVTRNGQLSCAFFVSSILTMFQLIEKTHGTVDATVKDLQKSGWKVIKKPRVGSVIVWDKADFGDWGIHKHIGFYVGDKKAISNSYKLGYPIEHSWTLEKRKIALMFWNPKLKF